MSWPDDYAGQDSMTHWVIGKSQGLTDVRLYRISESVRAYAYLMLSSQASVRSSIIAKTASALTTQKAFQNNFKNVVNGRVDVWEDIKRYQDTVSFASSKVDYSVAENIYMLPSDMDFNIKSGTVGYNNKILVSDGMFNLGKNDQVNTLEMAVSTPKVSHKDSQPTTTHGLSHKLSLTTRKELPSLILSLTGLLYGICLSEILIQTSLPSNIPRIPNCL